MTDGTTVVVVDESQPVIVNNLTGEVEAPQPETVEEVLDSAVAIAEIQSETAVELATIDGAVEMARIESQETVALAMAEQEEGLKSWLETKMNSLEQAVTILSTQLAALSTPQPLLVAEIPTDLTPQSTSQEISETLTELSPESVVEDQEVQIPLVEVPVKVKRRPI